MDITELIDSRIHLYDSKLDARICTFLLNLDKNVVTARSDMHAKTAEYDKLMKGRAIVDNKISQLEDEYLALINVHMDKISEENSLHSNKLYEKSNLYAAELEELKNGHNEDRRQQDSLFKEYETDLVNKIFDKTEAYEKTKEEFSDKTNALVTEHNDLTLECANLRKVKTGLRIANSLLEDHGDDTLCVICFERPREIITTPCGHYYHCNVCANKIERCSVCKQEIGCRYKVY